MRESLKSQSIGSFVWRTGQSVCTLGITFVIQLVLARLLTPEDFGVVAITTVFLALANTIIETSFSSSVIQREQLNQKLISSIFYANLALSLLVYGVLFAIAPCIALFYREPILIPILRIQGLRVVFSGLYSIPQAFLNRKMRFKELFICAMLGSVGQGIIGFSMAYSGAGVWALVISTLASSLIMGSAIFIVEKWRPSIYFSYREVKSALSFSVKILFIRVLRKIFYNIRTLTIGKLYTAETLGFFNKGFQFPSTIMTVIDGSLTSVAFTSMAKLQNNPQKLVSSLRQYVRFSMFLCTPLMIGMALVAEPMVVVLLTEKWTECIPYLQMICFTQVFLPLNVKTTAFEAIGDSETSMKLHVSNIAISIVLLVIAMPFSALAITFSGLISGILLQIAITIVTCKKMAYTVTEQIKDATCSLFPTLIMAIMVYSIGKIGLEDPAIELCLQVLLGAGCFVITSIVSKNEVFYSLLEIIKQKL